MGYQQRAGNIRSNGFFCAALLGIALGACDPPSGGGGSGSGGASAGGNSGNAGSAGASGAVGQYLVNPLKTNTWTVQLANTGGSSGSSGSTGNAGTGTSGGAAATIFQCASAPASHPSSPVCGDGFLSAGEDCDDGNNADGDGCSATCKITPELATTTGASSTSPPWPRRTLGQSRHPLAAGCDTVGVAVVDATSAPATLTLNTFSNAGARKRTLNFATSTIDAPDPVLAALPGDLFAAAWTDASADGDELGVRLASIDPVTGKLTSTVANESIPFSQSAPDMVFDGRELVVAWQDTSNAAGAPDLKYRLFSPDLTPLSGDLTLAATSAVEDDVVLAAFNGAWAAAWRSGSQGMETIEVQSGSKHWTVGPFLPGAAHDRPDLAFLDATHLAVAFTAGADPDGTGVANVAQLHGAILDAAAPGATASFGITPAQNPYAVLRDLDQTQPSIAVYPDHLLVSWRSAATPGDPRDGELWTRRIPFSGSADKPVTVDPSHLEVPLIRTDAARIGDQSAFRLVQTHAPGGGLFAAWEDQGRSLSSGTPDVAIEVLPDVADLPPAVNPYPLSADGKYYLVNVLRRNFQPPTAYATFSNDATQVLPTFLAYNPPAVFDGDDQGWVWTTPTHPDLDATAVMVVDMGQYVNIGAIYPFYYRAGSPVAPNSSRIEFATTYGNWQPVTTYAPTSQASMPIELATPTVARYIRFTEIGTNSGTYSLGELLVFPAATTSPSPTSADGYNLEPFSTVTRNSNLFPTPMGPTSPVWQRGELQPKGPVRGQTGDGVGVVDLGAQYQVSHISLSFFWSGWWTLGGKLEVAAIPDAYTTIADSGRGNPFGAERTTSQCAEYYFPSQPVRFIRVTSYFDASRGGADGNFIWDVQAYQDPPARTAYFPTSADGNYFVVNLAPSLAITATATYSNGAVTSNSSPSTLFDGNYNSFAYTSTAGATATATTTVQIDLGQVVSLGGIRSYYNGPMARHSKIRLSSDNTNWTTVNDADITVNDFTTSFAATSTRYIELTMTGTVTGNVASLRELIVYPSTQTSPAPSSNSHLDLTYLTGVTLDGDSNTGKSGDHFTHAVGYSYGMYFKTAAYGGTGDGVITLDLGQPYQVSKLLVQFFGAQNWPGGAKIQLDDGTGHLTQVYDTGRGNPFGVLGQYAPVTVNFPTQVARRILITGYFNPSITTSGVFENIEVY